MAPVGKIKGRIQMKKQEEQDKVVRVKVLHIGDIAIDTATLLLVDPMNATRVALEYDKKIEAMLSGDKAAEKFCTDSQCTDSKNGFHEAVFLPTGIGDGIYPVIATEVEFKTMGKRIMEVTVDFSNPFRGCGCVKPFPHRLTRTCEAGCKHQR